MAKSAGGIGTETKPSDISDTKKITDISTDLIDLLGYPSVYLLLGHRGKGKTACGCLLLQQGHKRGLKCFIVGLPMVKWHLLPKWITPVEELDDIPDHVAVFIDEAYLLAHAREHEEDLNIWLTKIIGVSRQKDWFLIISTHHTRKLDIDVIEDSDGIIFRKPSWLHMRFDRKEIRDLVKEAGEWFLELEKAGKEKGFDREQLKLLIRQWALVYSDEHPKPFAIQLELPSYWSEELSKAFSGVSLREIGKKSR